MGRVYSILGVKPDTEDLEVRHSRATAGRDFSSGLQGERTTVPSALLGVCSRAATEAVKEVVKDALGTRGKGDALSPQGLARKSLRHTGEQKHE